MRCSDGYALSPLTREQQLRAVEYVLRRFKLDISQTTSVATVLTTPSPEVKPQVSPGTPASEAIQDIRTLKESKLPKSAIEMAALVGYYVSELAPEGERKKEIGKADIERHFKAAGFKLPADASFTLVNAKNAGYLDSAGAGQYKLNPVGYNLVVHRMGNTDAKKSVSQSNGRSRPAKKRTGRIKK